MVMEWSPVLGSIQEFIDYALFIVGVLIIYYLIRFLTFGKEEKDKEWAKGGEALRGAIKEKWEASKKARKEREEKDKEDAEKRIREAEEKKIKDAKEKAKKEKKEKEIVGADIEHKASAKAKAEKRVKDKIVGYLMSVITLIDDSIKHLDKDEIKEANATFTKAKRRLSSAINSEVLEELANNTPHLGHAKALHSAIVQIGLHMKKTKQLSKSEITSLRQINQNLGAIHQGIGELIKKIFS